MWYCPHCSAENEDTEAVCYRCNKNPMTAKSEPIINPPKKEEYVKCPCCGSMQITANKKGYSAGKAVAGLAIAGGIGLLAGFIGSGNIKITCLKCGYSWSL